MVIARFPSSLPPCPPTHRLLPHHPAWLLAHGMLSDLCHPYPCLRETCCELSWAIKVSPTEFTQPANFLFDRLVEWLNSHLLCQLLGIFLWCQTTVIFQAFKLWIGQAPSSWQHRQVSALSCPSCQHIVRKHCSGRLSVCWAGVGCTANYWLFSDLLSPGPSFYGDEHFSAHCELNMPKETSRMSCPFQYQLSRGTWHAWNTRRVCLVYWETLERCCKEGWQGFKQTICRKECCVPGSRTHDYFCAW